MASWSERKAARLAPVKTAGDARAAAARKAIDDKLTAQVQSETHAAQSPSLSSLNRIDSTRFLQPELPPDFTPAPVSRTTPWFLLPAQGMVEGFAQMPANIDKGVEMAAYGVASVLPRVVAGVKRNYRSVDFTPKPATPEPSPRAFASWQLLSPLPAGPLPASAVTAERTCGQHTQHTAALSG